MRSQIKNKIRFPRFYFIAVPIVLFIILNVYWAVSAASFGARLISLEKKSAALQEENSLLLRQVIGATSLEQLSQKTESLGFSKPINIVYISQEGSVAKLP